MIAELISVAALLEWSIDAIRRLIYIGAIFGRSCYLVNEFIARRASVRGTYDGSSILTPLSSDGGGREAAP